MFCVQCGSEVKGSDAFCGVCGNRVESQPSKNSVLPQNFAQPQNYAQPQMVSGAPMYAGGYAPVQTDYSNIMAYIASGLLGLSVLCVLFNVGGIFSGFRLIAVLFRTLSDGLYMGGDGLLAVILLLSSHLLVLIFGVIGAIGFGRTKKCKGSCIMTIVGGALGILSGMIMGWNVTAETIALVGGIAACVLNSHMKAPAGDVMYNGKIRMGDNVLPVNNPPEDRTV